MNIENFVNETETANMALENTHYGAAAIEEMLSGGPKKIFFAGIGNSWIFNSNKVRYANEVIFDHSYILFIPPHHRHLQGEIYLLLH